MGCCKLLLQIEAVVDLKSKQYDRQTRETLVQCSPAAHFSRLRHSNNRMERKKTATQAVSHLQPPSPCMLILYSVGVTLRFFDGAPLIRVPGRVHPVEVRYVPTAADNDIQEVRELGYSFARRVYAPFRTHDVLFQTVSVAARVICCWGYVSSRWAGKDSSKCAVALC